MSTRRTLMIAGTVAIVLLLMPVMLLSLTNSSFVCPLASAQDNPCLAQEATISAMQDLLFQATIDHINFQSTVTAYKSASQNGGGNGQQGVTNTTNAPGLPFIETFDNNDNGWRLAPGIMLTNGELLINDKNDPIIPVAIDPNQFYIQLDCQIKSGYGCYVGFGDISGGNWITTEFSTSSKQIIIERTSPSGTEDLFRIDYDFSNTYKSPAYQFTAGIYVKNGQIEVYVNNEMVTLTQIETTGNEVMIGLYGSSGEARFDNLEIRTSR